MRARLTNVLAVAVWAMVLACALSHAPGASAQAGYIANSGLASNAQTLRVAVIVMCNLPGKDPILAAPEMFPASFDYTQCSFGLGGTYDDWFRVYKTYLRVVNGGGGVPSQTGAMIPLDVVFFNIGAVEYTNTNQTAVELQFKAASENMAVLLQQIGAFGGWNPAGNGSWTGYCAYCPIPYDPVMQPYLAPGWYDTLAGAAPKRFAWIIPPTFGDTLTNAAGLPSALISPVFTACQLSKQCLVFGQYVGTDQWRTCQSQLLYSPTGDIYQGIPPECTKAVDPTLRADKRPVQRRFDYGYGALPSQGAMMSQMIEWFKLKGASTAVWIATNEPTYASQVIPTASAALEANKITLFSLNDPITGVATDILTLPKASNWSPAQVTALSAQIAALNPDIFFFLGAATVPTDISNNLAIQLELKRIGWNPKALAVPGGTNGIVGPLMAAATGVESDGWYSYGATFNDFRMRSPAYDAPPSTTAAPTWEPFPSMNGQMAQMSLRAAYIADWGDTVPQKMLEGYFMPQISAQPLHAICKLFYLAGTDDVELTREAALAISVPTFFGQLQFDQSGRLAQLDQYVTQLQVKGALSLITPLSVGTPDIYPQPTWAERIGPDAGSASFLGTTNEKVVVAITTIINAYLLVLLALIGVYRNAAIIKSSSPTFCALMLLGCMLLVSSNYGYSLYATSAGCGASAWLLTMGFTLMISALILKTYRVWKIFESGKLQVVKISNAQLYVALGVLVGIDVLVNIIWSASAGFPTQYVSVDPLRPLYDYVTCGYSSTSTSFVYFHLAYKALILLAGIVITVLVRNVPSKFNEAPVLAASLYNCFLLLCFALPIVAAGVGGRNTTYLIRSFGLIVIVASTASILFLPKFHGLFASSANQGAAAASTLDNTKTTGGKGTHYEMQVVNENNESYLPAEGNNSHVPDKSSTEDVQSGRSRGPSPQLAVSTKKMAFTNSNSPPPVNIKLASATNNPARLSGPTSPMSPSTVELDLRSELMAARAEIAALRARVGGSDMITAVAPSPSNNGMSPSAGAPELQLPGSPVEIVGETDDVPTIVP